MAQIAEDFKVLNEEEQNEAYEKAKRELDERQAAWEREQKSFFDANPLFRDDPDLNGPFVLEVNRLEMNRLMGLMVTEEGMTMTDWEVLEAAKELAEKDLALRPLIKHQLN